MYVTKSSLWRNSTQYLVAGVSVIQDIDIAKCAPPSHLCSILGKCREFSLPLNPILTILCIIRWFDQFPESKMLGVPVSRCMRALVSMAARGKVDVDAFHKGIQFALEKLGKSKLGFERTVGSEFKRRRHEGSGSSLLIIECVHCHAIKSKIKNYATDKVKKLWYCRR